MSQVNSPSPTDEQLSAIELAQTGKSMKLVALAGSGKTSTLVMVANALVAQPSNRGGTKKGIYLAFNASIVKEAKRKMPKGVDVRTFHSLALSQCPYWMEQKLGFEPLHVKKFIEIFNIKDYYIRAEEAPIRGAPKKKVKKKITGFVQKRLVDAGLEKFMTTAASQPAERHIEQAIREIMPEIIEDDIKYMAAQIFPIADNLWHRYIDPNDDLGLGNQHNIYLKYWAIHQPKIDVDFILFDEAQDADPIMIGVLMNQPASVQLVYVGDPHQQIYAWRGAVNVIQELDLPARYLTQSFRFGDEIAQLCQPLLKELGEKNTFRGLTSKSTHVDRNTEKPTDIDAILCRTNLGVIQALVEFESLGLKGKPKNVEIKSSLETITAIEEIRLHGKPKKYHETLKLFSSYQELQAYCNEYPNDQSIVPYYKLVEEYGYNIITHILSSADAIAEADCDFIVTTAHRAKGLEWDNVLVYQDFNDIVFGQLSRTYGSRKRNDKLMEEFRLLYVAMTRGMKQLYIQPIATLLREIYRT